jgi:hypothetical protein
LCRTTQPKLGVPLSKRMIDEIGATIYLHEFTPRQYQSSFDNAMYYVNKAMLFRVLCNIGRIMESIVIRLIFTGNKTNWV